MPTPTDRFIKVHHGFPDHAKTMELSDKAFRHLITAWCFCAANRTDGKLTSRQIQKIFTTKTLLELIANGFVHRDGNAYEMHEFLDHQQSAADYDAMREKRAAAGRLGGQAKARNATGAVANGVALAKQTSSTMLSKHVAEVEVEVEREELQPQTSSVVAPPVARATRGGRLPDDFTVTPEMRAWAAQRVPGMDLGWHTEKFINHWQSATGASATKSDWVKAWKNWLMRDYEPKRATTTPPRKFGYG
jgi:hypothetical protein